jgi:uncharacterized repeat protein (TIGR03803 family)
MKRIAILPPHAIFAVIFLFGLNFLLNPGGATASTETILHDFNLTPNGQQPSGGLISDAAGNLYGTTLYGGSFGFGEVYKLSPNSKGGWVETVLFSFNGTTGGDGPAGTLVFDTAGNIYGGTIGGGSQQDGTIFKLTPHAGAAWTESVIWNFHGKDGVNPNGGLIFDKAGNLYGTTTSGGGLGRQTCINLGCGTAFRLSPGANGKWTLTTLYAFQGQSDGSNPNSGLAMDSAGNLYGTTTEGGILGTGLGYGVVFKLSSSSGGWTESVLYSFTGGADGGNPSSDVIFDASGNLYGVTADGANGSECSGLECGVVFELSPVAGGQWRESVLYSFNGIDGDDPVGNLTFDEAGNLYGTTRFGVSGAAKGTVFKLTHGASGWSERVLWNFTGGADGNNPTFGVTLGSSGQIYGAAAESENAGNGTVFELQAAQSGSYTETTLTAFPSGNGYPKTALVADASGNFYGATNGGAAYGFGGVYELSPSPGGKWTVSILYSFPSGLPGYVVGPTPSALIFDNAGNLYGELQYGGTAGEGTVYELSPSSGGKWTEKDLYTFTGGTDGGQSQGGLIFDSTGSLYGTTEYGGFTGVEGCRLGCGTVFKLTASSGGWSESVIYQFVAGGVDGRNPVASLVFDASGNLYGTTQLGGIIVSGTCGGGCGSVFELSPSGGAWTEHVLYLFSGKPGDGRSPDANVILDAAGNLYGTTAAGGEPSQGYCGTGCGTVFMLSQSSGVWKEKILLSFDGTDGATPLAPVIFDAAGNLYGTSQGFTGDTWGTVYKLSPSGGSWTETVLHSFPIYAPGDPDGYFPSTGLIFDSAGNLYGTAPGGGQTSTGGIVFEITP